MEVDQLTQDQIIEFKEAFTLVDDEDEGLIEIKKLKKIMIALNQVVEEEELQDMMDELDVNGNGLFGFPDFLTMMANNMKDTETEAALRQAFQLFDPENTGFILESEVRLILVKIGDKLTDEDVTEMMREFKTNLNGQVNYEEIIAMMTSRFY